MTLKTYMGEKVLVKGVLHVDVQYGHQCVKDPAPFQAKLMLQEGAKPKSLNHPIMAVPK